MSTTKERRKIFHALHHKTPDTGYVKLRVAIPPITHSEAKEEFVKDLEDEGYNPINIHKVAFTWLPWVILAFLIMHIVNAPWFPAEIEKFRALIGI